MENKFEFLKFPQLVQFKSGIIIYLLPSNQRLRTGSYPQAANGQDFGNRITNKKSYENSISVSAGEEKKQRNWKNRGSGGSNRHCSASMHFFNFILPRRAAPARGSFAETIIASYLRQNYEWRFRASSIQWHMDIRLAIFRFNNCFFSTRYTYTTYIKNSVTFLDQK